MANRVARVILGQRESAEAEPTALLLEKDAQMVAVMLGALKTGQPQVSLDPFFPHARIATLLEDSRARLIVTNDRNLTLAHELAQDGCVAHIDKIDSISTENLFLDLTSPCLHHLHIRSTECRGVAATSQFAPPGDGKLTVSYRGMTLDISLISTVRGY